MEGDISWVAPKAGAWVNVRVELTAGLRERVMALVRERPTAKGLALESAPRTEEESAAPMVLGTVKGSAIRLGLVWAVGSVVGLVPAWAKV